VDNLIFVVKKMPIFEIKKTFLVNLKSYPQKNVDNYVDNFFFDAFKSYQQKPESYQHSYPQTYPHHFFNDFIMLKYLSTYPHALLLLLLYIYKGL